MTTSQNEPKTLDRPGGTVAYDIVGAGRPIVCIPGLGDLRSTYRHLTPPLTAAGNQVVTMDLRGHGDSSVGFDSYDDEATAGDVEALLEQLSEPAVLVGNSMGAAAAVLVAARRPELVRGLVLLGGFVRNPPTSAAQRAMMRTLMLPVWARTMWTRYLPKLYAGRSPADLPEHIGRIDASLRRPGRSAAFSRTTRTSHAGAEAALPKVQAPTLVITGADDPDWKDPGAEARWIGDQLHARVLLAPDCGHYPQAQRPDVVAPAILALLADLDTDA